MLEFDLQKVQRADSGRRESSRGIKSQVKFIQSEELNYRQIHPKHLYFFNQIVHVLNYFADLQQEALVANVYMHLLLALALSVMAVHAIAFYRNISQKRYYQFVEQFLSLVFLVQVFCALQVLNEQQAISPDFLKLDLIILILHFYMSATSLQDKKTSIFFMISSLCLLVIVLGLSVNQKMALKLALSAINLVMLILIIANHLNFLSPVSYLGPSEARSINWEGGVNYSLRLFPSHMSLGLSAVLSPRVCRYHSAQSLSPRVFRYHSPQSLSPRVYRYHSAQSLSPRVCHYLSSPSQ